MLEQKKIFNSTTKFPRRVWDWHVHYLIQKEHTKVQVNTFDQSIYLAIHSSALALEMRDYIFGKSLAMIVLDEKKPNSYSF